jgi:hypothetical protein
MSRVKHFIWCLIQSFLFEYDGKLKQWLHQYEQTNNHISPQIIVHKNDHDIWHMHNADINSLRQSHKCDRVKSLNHLLWSISSIFYIFWCRHICTSCVDINLWLFVGWYWPVIIRWLILTCDYSLVDINLWLFVGWYWPVIIRWLILTCDYSQL